MDHAHLVLAGDDKGPYAETMKKLARDSGLKYRDRANQFTDAHACDVTFCGQLLGEKKTSVFAASTVLVLMSQSENFGMVAAEAMMAGVPVIVSDGVGIAPEIDEWEAGIVVPRTMAALSEAIMKLLSDPARASAMGGHGKSAALKHFSAEAVGKQMAKLYNSIAGVSSNQ
jgi:glycosyltransferase involved in cell wall biosynthesis